MTKFGVGVGEDFPLDEGQKRSPEDEAREEREEFEEWRRRRAEWRAHREERRRQHDEWRARKRAFKAKMRAAARESFGDGWDGRYRRGGFPFWPFAVVPLLGVLVVIALIAAVWSAPFLFLALVAVALYFAMHRRRHGDWHRDWHHDWRGAHDFDERRPSGPIVTPPPPPQTQG